MATPNAIRTFHLAEEAERGFAYAQATSADGLIHVAGTLALNDAFAPVGEGDMAAQLNCAYERIARTLAAHGVGFADVLKETLFVTSMDDMLASNGIRARVYGEHTPACTVVEVRRLAFPQCMVEIELVARARRG